LKKHSPPPCVIIEGKCAGPKVCPLSQVRAGQVVCIKELTTKPDVAARLRELGFVEDQNIRLVARKSNFICQVCNARLGISEKLADSILVETVPVGGRAG
jgi:Fe2+ transport system protein FeoA